MLKDLSPGDHPQCPFSGRIVRLSQPVRCDLRHLSPRISFASDRMSHTHIPQFIQMHHLADITATQIGLVGSQLFPRFRSVVQTESCATAAARRSLRFWTWNGVGLVLRHRWPGKAWLCRSRHQPLHMSSASNGMAVPTSRAL
jgi:hypothetical protein